MMFSMFRLGKRVQDVTKEILFELDRIKYPFIPFKIKGRESFYVRVAKAIISDMYSIQNKIELWSKEKRSEKWKSESHKLSQKILGRIKSINMEEIVLYSVIGGEEEDVKDSTEMLLSYIVKLGLLWTALSEWHDYLQEQERIHFKYKKPRSMHAKLKSLRKTRNFVALISKTYDKNLLHQLLDCDRNDLNYLFYLIKKYIKVFKKNIYADIRTYLSVAPTKKNALDEILGEIGTQALIQIIEKSGVINSGCLIELYVDNEKMRNRILRFDTTAVRFLDPPDVRVELHQRIIDEFNKFLDK